MLSRPAPKFNIPCQASDGFFSEKTPFAAAGSEDIQNNNQAALATCFVQSDKGWGSGVAVSLEGSVFVLTAAHVGTPKSVSFMISDTTATSLKLVSMHFPVSTFSSMQQELCSSAAQHDLQILLVDGNPEGYIKPLKLSSEIDPAQPITVYGFGSLVTAPLQIP